MNRRTLDIDDLACASSEAVRQTDGRQFCSLEKGLPWNDAMALASNEKLQQARGLLLTLIAEFSGLISEMRDLHPWEEEAVAEGGEPDYLQTIVRQRDTLKSAVEMLAGLQTDLTGCDSST
jgi:hypothetical protein